MNTSAHLGLGRRMAVGMALVAAAWSSSAVAEGPHWEYQGKHGAAKWAHLNESFGLCAAGKKQSPIDIRQTEKTTLDSLAFTYENVQPTVVNNGHTVQVNVPAGNRLVVGGKTYELLQFHFHTPSEEAINGKRSAMVAHFVHKSTEGQLGVVAVLFKPGKTNAAYQPVFANMPKKGESFTNADVKLDLPALLPSDLKYYAFEGSLTTPPCSEDVQWMVLKTPVALGAEQIKAFRRLYNANARPLQPLHGRVVKEGV